MNMHVRLWQILVVAYGIFRWGTAGSVVEMHGLSCSAACGVLVPWPGIKPMSPALEGWFLTTAPPEKSQTCTFLICMSSMITKGFKKGFPYKIIEILTYIYFKFMS